MAEDHQPASLELSDPLEETVHHTSARKRRGRDSSPPALQLTSMIDVIFLLLVYFVVTANFTKDEGVLKANLPGSDAVQAAPPPTDDPLIITVDPRDETGYVLTIENQPVQDFTETHRAARVVSAKPGQGPKRHVPRGPPREDRDRRRRAVAARAAAFNAAAKVGYENVQMEPRKV